MSDAVALAAIVILLFPMGYFFLASPAFLLVKLDIPEVARLLRGMFNAYFLMLSIAGAIGTLAFALTGHLAFAIVTGSIAAFAVWARRWFLQADGMPSLTPGMPAMPVRCVGCAGCIGAACCATRSSLPLCGQHSLCGGHDGVVFFFFFFFFYRFDIGAVLRTLQGNARLICGHGTHRKPDSGWLAGRKVLDFSTGVPRHADISTAIVEQEQR